MGEKVAGTKAALRAAITLSAVVLLGGTILVFDPDNTYLWIKAFHIIAVIAWMAGLLYLPRLLVYHHQTAVGTEASNLLKQMESRLFRIIMNPAMMIAWLAGLYLAWEGFRFQGGWLHTKLLAVVLLTGVHVLYGRAMRAFGRDERPATERFWRIMNEVPAVLLIIIVLMVVLKPF